MNGTASLQVLTKHPYVRRRNIGLGTDFNTDNECDLCDSIDVHFGQIIEYGKVMKFLGLEIARRREGRFVACRKCKDPIDYELRDYVPDEVHVT